MATTFFTLLDDVSAISKVAIASLDDVAAASAKAGAKTGSVIVDDIAVTPQYLDGFAAEREWPIVWAITKKSLINKVILVIAIFALNVLFPFLLTPLLFIGGLYLMYEGAHKISEIIFGVHSEVQEKMSEEETIKSAAKTDFILSAEILTIALSTVADKSYFIQAASLCVVAFLVTVLVYGLVAVIVKLDDAGLYLYKTDGFKGLGRLLLKSIPYVLGALSKIGTIAMLAVGGGIALHTAHEYHWDALHHIQETLHHVVPLGTGITDFIFSMIVGTVIGYPVYLATKLFKKH